MVGLLSFLSVVFGIVFAVSVVFLIVRSVRKKPRKPFVILAGASVVAFLACFVAVGSMYTPAEKPSPAPPSAPSAGVSAPSVTEDVPEVEPPVQSEPPAAEPSAPAQPETPPPVAEQTEPPVTSSEPEVAEPVPEETPPEPPEPPVAPSEPEPVPENPLLSIEIQEHPVMNGLKTERIGTWGSATMTKSEAMACTDEQFHEFLRSVDEKSYNWFNVFFEDGTGIYYMSGTGGYFFEYGVADSAEGGSVKDAVQFMYADGAFAKL